LITGGAGFVGRHLARALVQEGHQVRILDNLSEQVHGPASPELPVVEGAELIRGDIRNPDCLVKALDGIAAVAHLAAETGMGQSMYEVNRYVDVNEGGTACLLQTLIERQQPVRLVLASSRAVYGEGLYRCGHCGEVSPRPRGLAALANAIWDPVCPTCGDTLKPVPTHEGAPCEPGSVYAATKLSQEQLCRVVGAAYGFSVAVLRYFNVYGPGQSLSNPYTGILPTFYARAKAGKPIEVFEDGRESRDFVYIDDTVEATRRALLDQSPEATYAVINVGSGVPTSLLELARTVLRVGGWDVPIRVTGAFRVGDVRHAFADTARARQVLGFAATIPLAEGIRRWMQWADRSDCRPPIDAIDTAAKQLTARGLYRNAES
jgi:dTDP-L-rhamnose 4-epimerase